MRSTNKKAASKLQPLGISLARLRSAAAVAATLLAAVQSSHAAVIWDGGGDGVLWTDLLNWSPDGIPASFEDVIFASVPPAARLLLAGNQSVGSLEFTESFTIGAYGTNQVLTNAGGSVIVNTGDFATINASYGGSAGLNLTGGGMLYLNHPGPTFSGDIFVDGAGTTLVHRQEGPTIQYSGINAAQEFGRFDQLSLGVQRSVRNIVLSNGGEYRIINAGNNSEGGYKNIVIGSGGGTLNLAAGYIVQNLDDIGQIGVTTEAFTKTGKGRLTISGTMANGTGTAPNFTGGNPLAGIVNINGGMLDLSTTANTTVGANTYVRFSGIAPTGSTLNINSGGTLMINNGTQATLDLETINLNDGSILAVTGQDHIIGYATLTAFGTSSLNVTGTSTLLTRDLFGVQTQRFPRLRTQLDGTGTLQLLGNTNAGGTPRVVIERNTPGSTFTGTFRLLENTSLEANPRFNLAVVGGTGTVVDTGKLLADGDVEFAGFAGTLDIRDSNPAAASVLDYTSNEITVTTGQIGALNIIAPVRATAATGTGHLFNFGTLTMGDHRLAIAGNNSYQTGFADTASITGNAVIEMRSDNSTLVFSNAAAISEDAPGRSLKLIKTGVGSATTIRDVVVGGAISISNLEVSTGTLALRGADGAITTGFGGAAPVITVNGGASFTNSNPTFGVLSLDSNGTSASVAAAVVFGAGENNNRIDDSAILNMRSNSVLRLISQSNSATSEFIGTTNVSGHALFDIVKNGAPVAPVILTLNTLNLTGTQPTVNFTGTGLATAGGNSSRIIIPGFVPAGGVVPTFMGSQYHQGNEWAKYDATVDGATGIVFGVTPFAAGDYTVVAGPGVPVPGVHTKLTGTPFSVLAANTNTETINLQMAANQGIDLAGFVLTLDQGGILSSAATQGITDGATAAVPSGTAGITSATGQLYVHANAQLDIRTPITGAIDFVKSGTSTVRLIHQNLAVGTGATAVNPFTETPWASTLTGSWIINDGRLEVHRGQFLGGRPVVLNGGHLEINEPVSNANADTLIPGWGNNIIVNGNASVGGDDNGESADANTGDRAGVLLGSLTINNGSTLGISSFSEQDIAFMGGATFNGKATINTGIGRGNANATAIISGVLAGSGFDMVGYNGSSVLELGGTQTDLTNNTYSGAVTVYAGTLRLNKANGFTAITDSAAAEDVIINGGTLAWGTGQHGDLATTNSVNLTNGGVALGITPLSPVAIKNAGMNQIADTAAITLLIGTLGEADRINNETFGTLIQKNGTFNIGLGTMEVTTANISGGAVNIDRGGTLKVTTLNLLPGAPDMNVTTGIPTGAQSVLEIGEGGVSLTGQNIIVGTGSNGNVAGSGGVLKLGGNVTVVGSDLLGGSYGRKGIYVQTGSSFRELGNSFVDLAVGNRAFNIDSDVVFTITAPLANGGLIKNGGGALVLEPYVDSTFTGPIVVNSGVLQAKGDNAFGIGASSITVANGGTIKLDTGYTYNDSFTVSGPGALIPGGVQAREPGALIAVSGLNHLTGAVILAGNATLAGDTFVEPSVVPGAGGSPYRTGVLSIEGVGGVTGTGTLTLSGHGDGVIVNGIHTGASAVVKDGAGRWTISGASSYSGQTTITAGTVRVANGGALGSATTGTTIYGGALELAGGIFLAEPLSISRTDDSVFNGAIINVSGVNTLTGAIQLGANTALYSKAGSLNLGATASVTALGSSLTLSGAGNGAIAGALNLGTVTGADALLKTGSGTWTLTGSGTYIGTTAVNGGTLVTASTSAVLDSSSALNMGGGNFTNSGGVQATNGLNLLAGGGTVNGGVSGLAVGVIGRTAGATATFTGKVIAVGTPNDPTGILGAYGTVGTNWATVNGSSNVVAYSGYVNFAATSAAVTDNASTANYLLMTAATTRNTLKVTGGSGLDLGANDFVLTAGGLLHTSPLASGIAGTGYLTGIDSDAELIITNSGAPLDIAAPIVGIFGGGGLTKAGSGTLILSGSNTFSGPININAGTLSIVGPGGTAASPALGSSFHTMNINGGTFQVVGNDYDPGAGTLQVVVGPASGTIRTVLGAQISLNDLNQFDGSGDITFTGGSRFRMQAGTPRFTGFTGKVTVDGGILMVGDNETIGGRQDQTITLRPNSALINGAATGLGQNGLPNNLVLQGGTEVYLIGGNRAFNGDVQITGTNTIALMERDSLPTERQAVFNGRVSGTGVTLNVFGIVNTTPVYLASGLNDLTGNINLNANTVLEARMPGSLGQNNGDVTVNLNGANSRFLIRHWQNGDYRADVTVNAQGTEINSDRMAGFAGGGSQYLSINDVSINTPADGILTFGGGNAYTTRVAGTATMNSNTILNVTGGAGVLFDSGINFAGGADTLDKRGTASIVLHGAADHTGPTIVQGGFLILQGAGGALPNTSAIQLRGGELRVDNSSAVKPDRINNSAPISLGGGALRITGPEAIGNVTADSGTTQVAYNLISETITSALTLNGFTRATGAVVQFQADFTTLGATSLGSSRVSSRILIPGQADTTQTIPGFLGNNNLDFIQYDGTTIDAGVALGVRDMRNPGTVNAPSNYSNDLVETSWNDGIILRSGTGATLTPTASRALDAWKIEAAMTVNLGVNNLRIESGGILAVGAASTINGTAAVGLTAGKSVATAGVAELFIGGNNTLNINATIGNNAASGQSVALVKTGTGTLSMGNLSANTYSGGTYLHSGTLNTTTNSAFGLFTNPLFLDGGTLQLNVANAGTIGGLGGFGHAVNVRGNALIIADNGALAGIDNDYAFGALSINGPYTLGVRGFDSMDVSFIGTHVLSGTPTFDMVQAGSGSNPTTAATASVVTLNGAITGSGFYVTSTGNVDNTSAILQIGGGAGDTAANTFTGKLTTLQGTFTETNIIELNKAADTVAIPGDIEMNGAYLRTLANNQFGPTTNLVLNRGIVNFTATSQTLASIDMRGGELVTNPLTGAATTNSLTIAGNLSVTGLDDMAGEPVNGALVATGFSIGNNSTVTVNGLISIGTFGRIHLSEGQAGGFLNVNGGLELTGALLSQNNGAGPNTVRLSSDVTTLASIHPSNLGNSTDSDTFVDLNGTRTFTIADGPAGMDFMLSSVVRNSTSPVAVGGLVKSGPGTMQLQGGGTANSYTGGTTVNEGALLLFKSVNVNAIPTGTLTIGDGIGGSKADQVIVRNSNQISDTADVVLASSGLLDLDTFNTSETIQNLTGAAGSAIALGPVSTLTVNSTATTTYSGEIVGSAITKAGAGELTLDGALNVWTIRVDAGTLNINSNATDATVNANSTTNFGVSQNLTALNIGTVPFAPIVADDGMGAPFVADDGMFAPFVADDGMGDAASSAVVPEPGSIALLMVGALGFLGRRRRA